MRVGFARDFTTPTGKKACGIQTAFLHEASRFAAFVQGATSPRSQLAPCADD